jgi:hypothetical protein
MTVLVMIIPSGDNPNVLLWTNGWLIGLSKMEYYLAGKSEVWTCATTGKIK